MVAVGTRISPRPPHRSRRALLTHRAPPSGFGVEAVTRQRVYSSDWRKEAGHELDEPLPAEACRLAAPLERCEPEPLHLVEEPPQARVVGLAWGPACAGCNEGAGLSRYPAGYSTGTYRFP